MSGITSGREQHHLVHQRGRRAMSRWTCQQAAWHLVHRSVRKESCRRYGSGCTVGKDDIDALAGDVDHGTGPKGAMHHTIRSDARSTIRKQESQTAAVARLDNCGTSRVLNRGLGSEFPGLKGLEHHWTNHAAFRPK